LGNVKVVFNDYKEPVSGGSGSEKYDLNVLSLLNYYPFGMSMPGMGYEAGGSRYGFNGMEKDDEVTGVGNEYTALFWEYSPREVQRWNQDPKPNPTTSPYVTFSRNPIWYTDHLGDSAVVDNKGFILFNDEKDDNVYLDDGKNITKIGEIGGQIDINNIFPNLLKDNAEEAESMNILDYKEKVQTDGDWDLKNNRNTIFGLAWQKDEEKNKTKKNINKSFTQFSFKNYKLNAADIGNYNAGYTGKFTYGEKGMPNILLWYGAGAAETLKDFKDIKLMDFAKQLKQMIYFQPPFGDEVDDFLWNTKGMYDAKKIKEKVNNDK